MNSIKKNNSGFTLIELLITIVIIGIIATPFLNSFIQAMRINVEARRLQNATLAAQDLAEEFKAETISDLLNSSEYGSKFEEKEYTVNGKKVTGYQVSNIEVEGADGEDFFIDVKLDPSAIVDAAGTAINGELLPLFSNLYGGDTMIIFKQYVESDATVDKSTTKKISTLNIICQETHINGDQYSYTYNVTLEIKYENEEGVVIGTSTKAINPPPVYYAEDKHTMYLLASVFDKYTDTVTNGTEGNYWATDVININYTYLGAGDDGNERQPDFTFYLVEQAPTNMNDPEKVSRLNPSNINITYGSETKTLLVYESESSKFKINTNVNKPHDDSVSTGSLTYDPNNVGESLFLMSIEVRYGSEDGELLTTFTTTKEE